MEVQEAIQKITSQFPNGVQLVAVSKYHPKEAILEAYEAGQRIFGESKIQELCAKEQSLPTDIQWHFIGHLQRNKIKYIVPFISLIHSIDSVQLLQEVNKQAAKKERVIPCLLQVHIAQEETKYGFSLEECKQFCMRKEWQDLENIEIHGLMGMATNTKDQQQVEQEFESLHQLFCALKESCFQEHAYFKELSMGMSNDYPLAVAHGSTLVRIGTSIFGKRAYT